MFIGLVVGIAVGAAFSKMWIALYGVGKAWVVSKTAA